MSTKRIKNGKIFISYRRADARGVAGRLGDSLGQYFGDNRVFRDIEDIAAKSGACRPLIPEHAVH